VLIEIKMYRGAPGVGTTPKSIISPLLWLLWFFSKLRENAVMHIWETGNTGDCYAKTGAWVVLQRSNPPGGLVGGKFSKRVGGFLKLVFRRILKRKSTGNEYTARPGKYLHGAQAFAALYLVFKAHQTLTNFPQPFETHWYPTQLIPHWKIAFI